MNTMKMNTMTMNTGTMNTIPRMKRKLSSKLLRPMGAPRKERSDAICSFEWLRDMEKPEPIDFDIELEIVSAEPCYDQYGDLSDIELVSDDEDSESEVDFDKLVDCDISCIGGDSGLPEIDECSPGTNGTNFNGFLGDLADGNNPASSPFNMNSMGKPDLNLSVMNPDLDLTICNTSTTAIGDVSMVGGDVSVCNMTAQFMGDSGPPAGMNTTMSDNMETIAAKVFEKREAEASNKGKRELIRSGSSPVVGEHDEREELGGQTLMGTS